MNLLQALNGRTLALVVLWGALAANAHRVLAQEASSADRSTRGTGKSVIFIAGGPSHDYGSHEHYAGCRLLADTLRQAAPDVKCEIIRNGWPKEDSVLDEAHSIVIYADGGGGHPANQHLAKLGSLMDRGVGLVCLHYGVEVPKGEIGDKFLDWLGGYFETHWSVNPHWKADFQSLPTHPITRGVRPFQAQDEWYFHMRFRPNMEGVVPILSAIAPATTMERSDGPHSGNPDVRRSVARGDLQHVAWAYNRPNGGRSFGFTGGHFHWNWGRPEVSTLVANAILWSAGVEVANPSFVASPLPVDKLQENQDEPVPGNFSAESIQQAFQLIKTTAIPKRDAGRQLVKTPVVTTATPGHKMRMEVDVKGVKKLFLVVTDAGDGMNCDWADWIEPTLTGKAGTKKLTDLDWSQASSGWGQPRKKANAEGGPLSIQGKAIADGIGTHANSVIVYDLPEGFEKFSVEGGLDSGGSSQQNGGASSIQFAIYADGVPADLFAAGGKGAEQRTPDKAIAGLEVAPGLQATLAASEPTLKSLTNLDIDDRGRVWVCEVVNYRRHNGERPEGDRILILEDTNQDGVMDQSKVYYQGRDIDSALGLCVLGDRVIVSAAPYVLVFTDANGDDIPEKKEAIFTKTGQPQHDHSNHSFVFGPDGKLYWNFGNTGHAIFDSEGKPVLDRAGRPINDSGNPYRQGMAFRCNPDFSDMEVLGHNFRNNYELAVDSFGTIWQSDNDDDGNRATRINYVMEGGNFGYVDELTGEGWQAERTAWESEIPQRHWHLNDPGVVPNLLITGAGSPTGIIVYEGRMLPKGYWNQIIHCDAGPNVVRAYPTTVQGAGYGAEILNIVEGTRDKWFRPADVCVAPDGSLFVTDWYDPGVGGHNMEDMERGRLFRISPPNQSYQVPKYDWSTPEGCVQALASPAHSVRYRAWTQLKAMGEAALPALQGMWKNPDPRLQARALWVMSKISSDPWPWIRAGLDQKDPDLQIVAIRIARQANVSVQRLVEYLVKSKPAPSVFRELALSIPSDRTEKAPSIWALCALSYDGKDRWMLEALGIGASGRWEECLDAWLAEVKDKWNTPANCDIVWRARCPKAADLLVTLLLNNSTDLAQEAKWLRGLEFQSPEDRTRAMRRLWQESMSRPGDRFDRLAVEAAMRFPAESRDAELKHDQFPDRVSRYLKQLNENPVQLKLIKRLNVQRMGPRLLELAGVWGASSQGVQALTMAIQQGSGEALVREVTTQLVTDRAKGLAKTLAVCDGTEAMRLMEVALMSPEADTQVKIDLSLGLARTTEGQKRLLEMAKQQKLPGEAKALVGASLRQSKDVAVREGAAEWFPARKSSQSALPPVTELVKRRGDVGRGKAVFAGPGTCAQCHVVKQEGKNVGPDLSEIGSKLSREAMYVSILEPSAGISHNYEAYLALQDSGEVITGLLVSQTEAKVVLRDAKGIDRELPRIELEKFEKSDVSLMPANLEQAITEEGLVDLVEYLMSLQK